MKEFLFPLFLATLGLALMIFSRCSALPQDLERERLETCQPGAVRPECPKKENVEEL